MGNLGFPELIVIFVIILLIFGASRIPEIARSFGKGVSEFKKAVKGIEPDGEKENQNPDAVKEITKQKID